MSCSLLTVTVSIVLVSAWYAATYDIDSYMCFHFAFSLVSFHFVISPCPLAATFAFWLYETLCNEPWRVIQQCVFMAFWASHGPGLPWWERSMGDVSRGVCSLPSQAFAGRRFGLATQLQKSYNLNSEFWLRGKLYNNRCHMGAICDCDILR